MNYIITQAIAGLSPKNEAGARLRLVSVLPGLRPFFLVSPLLTSGIRSPNPILPLAVLSPSFVSKVSQWKGSSQALDQGIAGKKCML